MTQTQIQEKVDLPKGWVQVSSPDSGSVEWEWECKWCGFVEHKGPFNKINFDPYWDSPSEKTCYHCRRDADGKVEWDFYRQGDYGYYGDGDFVWNGTWKGEKTIDNCKYRDNRKWYLSGAESNYGAPIIKLYITVHSGVLFNRAAKKSLRRPRSWFAKLSIKDEYWWSVDVVRNRKCTSLKQVKEEVDALDLTESLAKVRKLYYNRDHVECVWIREGGEWRQLMSNFTDWSRFEWPNPYGWESRDYAVTSIGSRKGPDGKLYDCIHIGHSSVSTYSSSGTYWDEQKLGKKPVPWITRPGYALSEDIDVNQTSEHKP